MEIMSDGKFNLLESNQLIVNNITIYKIIESKNLNKKDSGILYIIKGTPNKTIKIGFPEVIKGLNFSFLVEDDVNCIIEIVSNVEIVGKTYVFRSDIEEEKNKSDYIFRIKTCKKGDYFKIISDENKYYLVDKSDTLNSINLNVYEYPKKEYYKTIINNNEMIFVDSNNNVLNNIIKGFEYNLIVENNIINTINSEEVLFFKIERVHNLTYPKFQYTIFDIYNNKIDKLILYNNTSYLINCSDISNLYPNSNNINYNSTKDINIYSTFNNSGTYDIKFTDELNIELEKPLIINNNIKYNFIIKNTHIIKKIKLSNNNTQISTNDILNNTLKFNASTENRGGFNIDTNHVIKLEIELSNLVETFNIFILERIVPEFIDNLNNKIDFLSTNNNLYKINVIENNNIVGLRGKFNTNDILLNNLAIDASYNLEINNNISRLITWSNNDEKINIVSNYYKDLSSEDKLSINNSNIVIENDNNYVYKLIINNNNNINNINNNTNKINYKSELLKNKNNKTLNISNSIIDNDKSGKLISLDNSIDLDLELVKPVIGNKFKFIINKDNSVLNTNELIKSVSIKNNKFYIDNSDEDIILYTNNKYIFDLSKLKLNNIKYEFDISLIEDGSNNYGEKYDNNSIINRLTDDLLELNLSKNIEHNKLYFYSEGNKNMGGKIIIKNNNNLLKIVKIYSDYKIVSNIGVNDNNLSSYIENNKYVLKINKGTKGKYVEFISLNEEEYIINDTNITYNKDILNLPLKKEEIKVYNIIENNKNKILLLDKNNNEINELYKNVEYVINQEDQSNINPNEIIYKSYYLKIVRDLNENKILYKFKIFNDSNYTNEIEYPLVLYRNIKYKLYQYDSSNKNLLSNNNYNITEGLNDYITLRQITVNKNNIVISININNSNIIKYWGYSLNDSRIYFVSNNNKDINITGLFNINYVLNVYGFDNNNNIINRIKNNFEINEIDTQSNILFYEDIDVKDNIILPIETYKIKIVNKIINNKLDFTLKLYDSEDNNISTPLIILNNKNYKFDLTDKSLMNVNVENHMIDNLNIVNVYVKSIYEMSSNMINNNNNKTYNFYGFKFYSDNNFINEIDNPILISKNNYKKEYIKYRFHQNNECEIEGVLLKMYIVPEDYIYNSNNILNTNPQNSNFDYLEYLTNEKTLEIDTSSNDLISFYKEENNNISLTSNGTNIITVNTITNHYENINNNILISDVYDIIEVESIYNISKNSNKLYYSNSNIGENILKNSDIICLKKGLMRIIKEINQIEKYILLDGIVYEDYSFNELKKYNEKLNNNFIIKEIISKNEFTIDVNENINKITYNNCTINKNSFELLQIKKESSDVIMLKTIKSLSNMISIVKEDTYKNIISINNSIDILNGQHNITNITELSNTIEIRINVSLNSIGLFDNIKIGNIQLSFNKGRYYKNVMFLDTNINNENITFNNYISDYNNDKKIDNKIYIIPSINLKMSKYETGILNNKLISYDENSVTTKTSYITYSKEIIDGIVYNNGSLNLNVNDNLLNDLNNIDSVKYDNNILYLYGSEYDEIEVDKLTSDNNNLERNEDDFYVNVNLPIIINSTINGKIEMTKNKTNSTELTIMVKKNNIIINNKNIEYKYFNINNTPINNSIDLNNSNRIVKLDNNNYILKLINNYDSNINVDIYEDKYGEKIYNNSLNDLNLNNTNDVNELLFSFNNNKNSVQKLYIFSKNMIKYSCAKDSTINDNKLYLNNSSLNKDIYSGKYIIIYNKNRNLYLKRKIISYNITLLNERIIVVDVNWNKDVPMKNDTIKIYDVEELSLISRNYYVIEQKNNDIYINDVKNPILNLEKNINYCFDYSKLTNGKLELYNNNNIDDFNKLSSTNILNNTFSINGIYPLYNINDNISEDDVSIKIINNKAYKTINKNYVENYSLNDNYISNNNEKNIHFYNSKSESNNTNNNVYMNIDYKNDNYGINNIYLDGLNNNIILDGIDNFNFNFNKNDKIMINNNNCSKLVGFVNGFYNSNLLTYYDFDKNILSINDTIMINNYFYIIKNINTNKIFLETNLYEDIIDEELCVLTNKISIKVNIIKNTNIITSNLNIIKFFQIGEKIIIDTQINYISELIKDITLNNYIIKVKDNFEVTKNDIFIYNYPILNNNYLLENIFDSSKLNLKTKEKINYDMYKSNNIINTFINLLETKINENIILNYKDNYNFSIKYDFSTKKIIIKNNYNSEFKIDKNQEGTIFNDLNFDLNTSNNLVINSNVITNLEELNINSSSLKYEMKNNIFHKKIINNKIRIISLTEEEIININLNNIKLQNNITENIKITDKLNILNCFIKNNKLSIFLEDNYNLLLNNIIKLDKLSYNYNQNGKYEIINTTQNRSLDIIDKIEIFNNKIMLYPTLNNSEYNILKNDYINFEGKVDSINFLNNYKVSNVLFNIEEYNILEYSINDVSNKIYLTSLNYVINDKLKITNNTTDIDIIVSSVNNVGFIKEITYNIESNFKDIIIIDNKINLVNYITKNITDGNDGIYKNINTICVQGTSDENIGNGLVLDIEINKGVIVKIDVIKSGNDYRIGNIIKILNSTFNSTNIIELTLNMNIVLNGINTISDNGINSKFNIDIIGSNKKCIIKPFKSLYTGKELSNYLETKINELLLNVIVNNSDIIDDTLILSDIDIVNNSYLYCEFINNPNLNNYIQIEKDNSNIKITDTTVINYIKTLTSNNDKLRIYRNNNIKIDYFEESNIFNVNKNNSNFKLVNNDENNILNILGLETNSLSKCIEIDSNLNIGIKVLDINTTNIIKNYVDNNLINGTYNSSLIETSGNGIDLDVEFIIQTINNVKIISNINILNAGKNYNINDIIILKYESQIEFVIILRNINFIIDTNPEIVCNKLSKIETKIESDGTLLCHNLVGFRLDNVKLNIQNNIVTLIDYVGIKEEEQIYILNNDLYELNGYHNIKQKNNDEYEILQFNNIREGNYIIKPLIYRNYYSINVLNTFNILNYLLQISSLNDIESGDAILIEDNKSFLTNIYDVLIGNGLELKLNFKNNVLNIDIINKGNNYRIGDKIRIYKIDFVYLKEEYFDILLNEVCFNNNILKDSLTDFCNILIKRSQTLNSISCSEILASDFIVYENYTFNNFDFIIKSFELIQSNNNIFIKKPTDFDINNYKDDDIIKIYKYNKINYFKIINNPVNNTIKGKYYNSLKTTTNNKGLGILVDVIFSEKVVNVSIVVKGQGYKNNDKIYVSIPNVVDKLVFELDNDNFIYEDLKEKNKGLNISYLTNSPILKFDNIKMNSTKTQFIMLNSLLTDSSNKVINQSLIQFTGDTKYITYNSITRDILLYKNQKYRIEIDTISNYNIYLYRRRYGDINGFNYTDYITSSNNKVLDLDTYNFNIFDKLYYIITSWSSDDKFILDKSLFRSHEGEILILDNEIKLGFNNLLNIKNISNVGTNKYRIETINHHNYINNNLVYISNDKLKDYSYITDVISNNMFDIITLNNIENEKGIVIDKNNGYKLFNYDNRNIICDRYNLYNINDIYSSELYINDINLIKILIDDTNNILKLNDTNVNIDIIIEPNYYNNDSLALELTQKINENQNLDNFTVNYNNNKYIISTTTLNINSFELISSNLLNILGFVPTSGLKTYTSNNVVNEIKAQFICNEEHGLINNSQIIMNDKIYNIHNISNSKEFEIIYEEDIDIILTQYVIYNEISQNNILKQTTAYGNIININDYDIVLNNVSGIFNNKGTINIVKFYNKNISSTDNFELNNIIYQGTTYNDCLAEGKIINIEEITGSITDTIFYVLVLYGNFIKNVDIKLNDNSKTIIYNNVEEFKPYNIKKINNNVQLYFNKKIKGLIGENIVQNCTGIVDSYKTNKNKIVNIEGIFNETNKIVILNTENVIKSLYNDLIIINNVKLEYFNIYNLSNFELYDDNFDKIVKQINYPVNKEDHLNDLTFTSENSIYYYSNNNNLNNILINSNKTIINNNLFKVKINNGKILINNIENLVIHLDVGYKYYFDISDSNLFKLEFHIYYLKKDNTLEEVIYEKLGEYGINNSYYILNIDINTIYKNLHYDIRLDDKTELLSLDNIQNISNYNLFGGIIINNQNVINYKVTKDDSKYYLNNGFYDNLNIYNGNIYNFDYNDLNEELIFNYSEKYIITSLNENIENINNDLNTNWISQEKIYNNENDTTPKFQYLNFTFDLKVCINKFIIYGNTSNVHINKNIKSGIIFASNNNSDFIQLHKFIITKGEWLLNDNYINISFNNYLKYKYYKLEIQDTISKGYNVLISNVILYSKLERNIYNKNNNILLYLSCNGININNNELYYGNNLLNLKNTITNNNSNVKIGPEFIQQNINNKDFKISYKGVSGINREININDDKNTYFVLDVNNYENNKIYLVGEPDILYSNDFYNKRYNRLFKNLKQEIIINDIYDINVCKNTNIMYSSIDNEIYNESLDLTVNKIDNKTKTLIIPSYIHSKDKLVTHYKVVFKNNKFYLNDIYKPKILLYRNVKYTFDLSDISLIGNEFKLSEDNDGRLSNTSIIADGIVYIKHTFISNRQGKNNCKFEINVPLTGNFPKLLYYFNNNDLLCGNKIILIDNNDLNSTNEGVTFYHRGYYNNLIMDFSTLDLYSKIYKLDDTNKIVNIDVLDDLILELPYPKEGLSLIFNIKNALSNSTFTLLSLNEIQGNI